MIYVIIGISLLAILFIVIVISCLLNPKDLKEFAPMCYHITDEAGNRHVFVCGDDFRDFRRMKEAVKDWSPLCRVNVCQRPICVRFASESSI